MRRKLARLSLALVSVLIGLAACETALRLFKPRRILDEETPYLLFTNHHIWHHWPRPSQTVTTRKIITKLPDEQRLLVFTHNSLGLRYGEIKMPKDRRRILVLGDSFVYGYYEEDTVSARLEKRTGYEVINGGSSTYSPLLIYLRLKNQLINLEPDEIILAPDLTDVYDDYWRYRPLTAFSATGEPLACGGTSDKLHQVTNFLRAHFYLARLAFSLYHKTEKREAEPAPTSDNVFIYYSTLPVESEQWQRDVGFFLNNIRRIMLLCKEHNIKLTVTTYPHRQQLDSLWNREVERRIESLCAEEGVDYFSAYDGLAKAYAENKNIYLEGDMHFRPEGQRVWADIIGDYYVNK